MEVQNLGRKGRPTCEACGNQNFFLDQSRPEVTQAEWYALWRCSACGELSRDTRLKDMLEEGGPAWH
jgi:hypothetical protein